MLQDATGYYRLGPYSRDAKQREGLTVLVHARVLAVSLPTQEADNDSIGLDAPPPRVYPEHPPLDLRGVCDEAVSPSHEDVVGDVGRALPVVSSHVSEPPYRDLVCLCQPQRIVACNLSPRRARFVRKGGG